MNRPALGRPRRHLGLDPLVQRPRGRRVVRLPLPPAEDLAVRADVLVVQRPHHLGVDLAGEAERRGAGALPVAGRLARRAGVVVGALAVPTASVRYAVSYPVCRLSTGNTSLSRATGGRVFTAARSARDHDHLHDARV